MNYNTLNTFDSFANWDDYIDAFIYINLENREDRKKMIVDEFKKIDIPEDKTHKIAGIFTPKNGHKGCAQAGILAFTLAKLNNWDRIMLVEDDMELSVTPVEFHEKLNYMFTKFQENNIKWDCIILGQVNGNKTDTSMDHIKRIKGATTTTCMIVPKHFYDTMINNFKSSNDLMAVDKKTETNFEKYATDQRWKELQDVFNFYSFDNDLVHQRNVWSSTMKYSY